MNINKFLDKSYEKMSFRELTKAPYEALQGISEEKAALIKNSFNKKALSKFVKRAQAVVALAKAEE